MKYQYSNELATEQRLFHLNKLKEEGYVPNFDKKKMNVLLSVRYDTLYNYFEQFGLYFFAFYKCSNFIKRWYLRRLLGKRRVFEIITSYKTKNPSHFVTINEIFMLYNKLDLKKEFSFYFFTKTQLSYSIIESHPIKALVKPKKDYHKDPLYSKFPQFVICIMSEYIVINNLMFASEQKISKIRSIDTWLQDVDVETTVPSELGK